MEHEFVLDPSDIELNSELKAAPLPALDENPAQDDEARKILARAAAQQGLKALQGHQGLTRDSLVYAASAYLLHLGRFSTLTSASRQVRTVLDNGKALAHFQGG